MVDSSLAVLIDAENSEAKIAEGLFSEIAKYGTASVKRIYGNWESPPQGWNMHILHNFAITPVQVYPYAKGKDGTGKNSVDHVLQIDAMDLLYTGKFDGFCLVTSDSDYTRLATRLRESKLVVYGFGRNNTPISFVNACDKFIYTEILRQNEEVTPSDNNKPSPVLKDDIKQLKADTKLMNMLRESIEAVSDEKGWAYLSKIGAHISKQYPSFDPRNYGFAKLSGLVSAIDLFEIREEPVSPLTNAKQLFVKNKKKKKGSPKPG